MALEEAELTLLKRYVHIDSDVTADNDLLEMFYASAVSYLAGAGVDKPDPTKDAGRYAQFREVVFAMVAGSYDRRDPTITGTIVAENPELRRKLTQLKLTVPVKADDA